MRCMMFCFRLYLLCCLTSHTFGMDGGHHKGNNQSGSPPHLLEAGLSAPEAAGAGQYEHSLFQGGVEVFSKIPKAVVSFFKSADSHRCSEQDILAEWNRDNSGDYCGTEERVHRIKRTSSYDYFRTIDPVFFAFKTRDEQIRYLKDSYCPSRYCPWYWTTKTKITLSMEEDSKDPVLAYARELERANIINITGCIRPEKEQPGALIISGPANAIQYLKDIPKIRVQNMAGGPTASQAVAQNLPVLPKRPELLKALNPPDGRKAKLTSLWVAKHPLLLQSEGLLRKRPSLKKQKDFDLYRFETGSFPFYGKASAKHLSVYSGFKEIGVVFFYLKTEEQQKKYLDSLGIEGNRYLSRKYQSSVWIDLSAEEYGEPVEAYAEKLERAGIIKIISGLDSFPGSIEVCGPNNAIQYLKDLPRIIEYAAGYPKYDE